jgi:ABC-type branched-subunit amino acid transport system ATPase component
VKQRVRDWAGAAALPARDKPGGASCCSTWQAVRKEFGGLVAVNDVSFQIHAGDIVGLIGPNGAGKSTTFNLVTGVLSLTRGSVQFRGESVAGLPSRQIARRGMSRTFQHVKMIPEMTVLENVALGGYLRSSAGAVKAMLRLDRDEERRLFAEAERQLQRIGMDGQMHELAGNLALGPQRLMEIARALCTDPALLLLDEPAAGLRHKEKQALGDVLRQLKREGMSILLVEHDMDFVMGLTDRIVVMEFGTKLIEGTPAEVQASPRCAPPTWAPNTDMTALLHVTDLHAGYGRAEVLSGLNLRLDQGQRGHRDRPQRRRQVDHAERADGRAARTRPHRLRRPGHRRRHARRARDAGPGAGAREARAVRHHAGGRQPDPGRLPRDEAARAALARQIEQVYELFPRLKERRTQLAGTLSGGERQMLAVGRALMSAPKLLMLDEPSLGLAPLVVREIFRIIARLREQGTSILLVEQNARAALEVADHGYVLETGSIALEGPADQLADDPRVIETYLGAAAAKRP